MAVEIPTGSPFAQGHQDPTNYGARRWEACSSDIKLESCGGEVFFLLSAFKIVECIASIAPGGPMVGSFNGLVQPG